MGEVVLSARGVSKQFFRKGRASARYFDAVAPCDLDLRRGEFTVLTGRSGSGKSTLLNLLAGLIEPTRGNVIFSGQDLYQLDDGALSRLRNERFGVIPQGQTALHSLSVIDNVLLPAGLYDVDVSESRAFELLERVGIAQLADSFPNELSGGELRRMALARALISEPAVVFADEPTGDLDDENTKTVLDLLSECARGGACVFMVTHERAAEGYSTRTMRMSAGVLEG